MKEFQNCGLQVTYREDANVNRFLRRTAALAFVPVHFVRVAWQAIKASAPQLPHIQEFICYFEDTSLVSNFPLTMWNFVVKKRICTGEMWDLHWRNVRFAMENAWRSGDLHYRNVKFAPLLALYDNGQSYHVLHLHTPGQHKIHQTQTPAKLAMTTNTAFITQAVLCEATYSIIHAQHKKSLPLMYNSALVVQRTDWCSLRRPCSHHFPLPSFKLHTGTSFADEIVEMRMLAIRFTSLLYKSLVLW